ncbi:aspartic peptidase domain-containing protein [Lasiosphaeria hispida]|uniref:Aspartic peptidase domain-containing protein n=1 Tax=Lasiosphaeria hispida TaxID=260671 RepID=A0AAJ0H7X8_9PEZI|nr:aspartic peptidase domain-containing protein [Lasiosphaeria hispida]
MPALSALVAVLLAVGGVVDALPPRIGTPRVSSPSNNTGAGASADAGSKRSTPPGTASLTQIRNPSFIPNGPLALAKAYSKYGQPLPPDLQAFIDRIHQQAQQKRSTGSVVTTPQQYDVEYLTPVTIGTPGQNLEIDIDTGSSDFWVFSSETPKSQVNGQTCYNPKKSSTAKKLDGATWEIEYGDGSSSSGDVYLDKVKMGGLNFSSQAIEAATRVSDEFTEDTNNDGLMGLAFGLINQVRPQKQKTFFENLQPSLDKPLFTADLKSGAPGHFNFGYIDKNAYTGSITYTPVNSTQGFWMWTSPGYTIGASGKFKSSPIQGIADTGTTLLLLPSSVVTAYYKKVSGAGYDSSNSGYVFPCDATLPSFYVSVGDSARIKIPGQYMSYAPVDSQGQNCFGGMQSDDGIGFSIFGDVFLKAAFVVFDAGKERLGLAAKKLP